MIESVREVKSDHQFQVEQLLYQLTQQQTQLLETYKTFLENLSLETSLQSTREQVEMLKLAGSQLISVQKEQVIHMLGILYPMFGVINDLAPLSKDPSVDLIGDPASLERHDLVELSCLLKCYLAKLALKLYHATAINKAKLYQQPYVQPWEYDESTTPEFLKESITPTKLFEQVNDPQSDLKTEPPNVTHKFDTVQRRIDKVDSKKSLYRHPTSWHQCTNLCDNKKVIRRQPKRGFFGQMLDVLCCGNASVRGEQCNEYVTTPSQMGNVYFVPASPMQVHPSFNVSPITKFKQSSMHSPASYAQPSTFSQSQSTSEHDESIVDVEPEDFEFTSDEDDDTARAEGDGEDEDVNRETDYDQSDDGVTDYNLHKPQVVVTAEQNEESPNTVQPSINGNSDAASANNRTNDKAYTTSKQVIRDSRGVRKEDIGDENAPQMDVDVSVFPSSVSDIESVHTEAMPAIPPIDLSKIVPGSD